MFTHPGVYLIPFAWLCGNLFTPAWCHVNVPTTLILSYILVRRCTHISTCMNVISAFKTAPLHLHSFGQIYGPLCKAQSPIIFSNTLIRGCTYFSTCIYVCLYLTYALFLSHSYVEVRASVWPCICVLATPYLVPHHGWKVYIYQQMYVCPIYLPYLLYPLCIVVQKCVLSCVSRCACLNYP